MIRISTAETNQNRKANKGSVKYPDVQDARFDDGMIFPGLKPGFSISKSDKVFTLGSCFARNIERQLGGYDVPTTNYVPEENDPLKGRGNTVFNEYNAGTIAQRITAATAGGVQDDTGIIAEGTGVSDFYITGSVPTEIEIVRKRRALMRDIYAHLPSSDLLIVTLGMVEAWFDLETQTYLNRAPGPECFRDPENKGARFELRILNHDECLELLTPAFEKAFAAGLKRIMLTVSPVPLQRTFGADDAVIANSYSKATLRSVATSLAKSFETIDYFPSYEMVTLFAGNPFIEDNVHVKPEIVARVTKYMLEVYGKAE